MNPWATFGLGLVAGFSLGVAWMALWWIRLGLK
jgi:hypothetical protein